jgi:hypothetical protein
MKAVQWKARATVETGMGGDIDGKATISLGKLDIVGHPVTIDDELVCRLVSLWDEDGGTSKQPCLWVGWRELAGCKQRCGDERKRMNGREVAMPGMSGIGK